MGTQRTQKKKLTNQVQTGSQHRRRLPPTRWGPGVARIALAAALLLPAVSHARWTHLKASEGRTAYAFDQSAPAPPITQFARTAGDFGNRGWPILVDGDWMYVEGYRGINAYKIPRTGDTTLEPLELVPEWEATFPVRESLLPVPSVLFPAITRSRLIYATIEAFSDNGMILRAVNRFTGEEDWTVSFPEALNANMTVTDGFYGDYVIVLWSEGSVLTGTEIKLGAFSERTGQVEWSIVLPDIFPGADKMTISRNRLFTLSDGYFLIVARDTATGDELWRYEDTKSQELEFTVSIPIYDMAAIGDLVILTYGPRIFALNAETGEEVWETNVSDREECISEATFIATNGDVLLLTGVCKDQIVALDALTGEEMWRNTPGNFVNITGVAAAGNIVYFINQPPFDNIIWAADIETGEVLLEYDPDYSVFQQPITVDGGRLFFPAFHEGDLVVNIYERQPTDVAIELTSFPECGGIIGGPMEYEYVVRNQGFGPAEDVRIRFYTPDGMSSVVTDRGNCSGERFFDCDIGTLEPGEAVNVSLTFLPAVQAVADITAQLLTRTRDTNPDNNKASETVEVLEIPMAGLDLSVRDIEVTQAVQNLDNEVPLVAGKPTMVRVHVGTGGGTIPSVEALLHGTRNGEPLPDSPLNLVRRCNPLPPIPDRANIEDSLNFVLPKEWREDAAEITLRAELNPSGIVPENDYTNNEGEVTVFFIQLPPLCLKTYAVHTDDSSGNSLIPSGLLPESIEQRTESLMPYPNIRLYPQYGKIIEDWEFFSYGPYEITEEKDQGGAILDTLWWRDVLSNDPRACKNQSAKTLYMGLLDKNTKDRDYSGLARTPGEELLILMDDEVGSDLLFDDPSGGSTLAQEIGHNYDRYHVDCGDPEDDSLDPDYPYDPCTLGPSDPAAFYGTDFLYLEDLYSITPAEAEDFMSYGSDPWVSDYTWNAIARELCQQYELCVWPPQPPGRRSAEPQPFIPTDDLLATLRQAEEYLLVSGLVQPEGGEVLYTYRVPQGLAPLDKIERMFLEQQETARRHAEEITLFLDLVDSEGAVLDTQPFPMGLLSDGTGDHFGAVAPVVPGTAGIRIHDGFGIIASRDASETTPTVTLTSPNTSDVIGEDILIEWDAEDADGDELVFTIQYTFDDGANWEVLADNYRGDMLVLTADRFPGGDDTCRIRIIASDGFLTAFDETGNFTVPFKEPTVSISYPGDGAVFDPGSLIIMRGSAFDPEDGPLLDMALSWTLEGGEEILITDSGEEFYVGSLEEGTYDVTLEAEDIDGNIATGSITIEVRRPTAIGSIVSVILGQISPEAAETDLNEDSLTDTSDITTRVNR